MIYYDIIIFSTQFNIFICAQINIVSLYMNQDINNWILQFNIEHLMKMCLQLLVGWIGLRNYLSSIDLLMMFLLKNNNCIIIMY